MKTIFVKNAIQINLNWMSALEPHELNLIIMMIQTAFLASVEEHLTVSTKSHMINVTHLLAVIQINIKISYRIILLLMQQH